MRRLLVSVLAITLCLCAAGAAFAEKTLTLATLAPEKSAWDKVFRGMAKELDERTSGAVKLRIYAGGVQGDEEVVIKKMKTGQIHGAAVTSVGLGKISQNVLVFQLPMLFENWDELDYVRDRMKAGLEAEMLEREFVLVGWGDVGFAHLFSNEPVVNPSDLGKVKMWSWQSDPIAQQFVRDCGGNPVPLPLPDVMPSLETGLVNAYVNSPLGAIALRWFTKVKYMTKKHNAVAIGATVLSKSAWESLTPDEQKIFREVSDKWSKILTKKVRLDNDKSYELLTSQGISLVEIPESTEAEWRRIATGTADKLADKVYTKATLDEVRRLLAEKRKSR